MDVAQARGSVRFALTAILAVMTALGLGVAQAIPRYAAHYEQKCSLCHQDPSGGGQRSLYAVQYLIPAEMALAGTGAEGPAFPDPQLGENVTVGMDLRTLYLDSDNQAELQNFFQMQSDLYLTFRLAERFSAHLDRGISGNYEVFGLAYILPGNGYLKIGRFSPAFGWRLADHTAFVRANQGFAPPAHTDVGCELGFYPGPFAVQLGALNGSRGTLRDRDNNLAVSLRTLARANLAGFALALGGSYYREDAGEDRPDVAGIFGSLSWRGLSWLAETGWTREQGAAEEASRAWNVSQQFALQLQRGLDVLVTYDFHDPDTEVHSGSLARWGGGLDLLAYPFLHLKLMLSHYHYTDGRRLSGSDYHHVMAQVHLLY